MLNTPYHSLISSVILAISNFFIYKCFHYLFPPSPQVYLFPILFHFQTQIKSSECQKQNLMTFDEIFVLGHFSLKVFLSKIVSNEFIWSVCISKYYDLLELLV